MEIFNNPLEYKKWYEKHKEIYESEKELVKILNLKDCLDIGSGPSIFHEVINGRIISLDISKEMLKFANNEEDRVVGDALHLPFRDKSIPCVFISVTLCFINDLNKLIEEVKRVVVDELCICMIPRDSSWGEYYFNLGKKGHKYYSKANFITKEQIVSILKKNFKIKGIYSTLTYTPFDKERFEYPREGLEGSFICIKAIPID